MDKKHCSGCRNDFYNNRKEGDCWSLEKAELVQRIAVGFQECPPYLNRKPVTVPNCWQGEGPHRTLYVDPSRIDSKGFWK